MILDLAQFDGPDGFARLPKTDRTAWLQVTARKLREMPHGDAQRAGYEIYNELARRSLETDGYELLWHGTTAEKLAWIKQHTEIPDPPFESEAALRECMSPARQLQARGPHAITDPDLLEQITEQLAQTYNLPPTPTPEQKPPAPLTRRRPSRTATSYPPPTDPPIQPGGGIDL
ncbi:MAG: hypothetical protein ACLP0J_09520 [Solirubrobacteraceae bacterium]